MDTILLLTHCLRQNILLEVESITLLLFWPLHAV
jgi:hypothetical protein